MNCRECTDLVQAYLDSGVMPRECDLDVHLRSCPECAARGAAARRLLDGLRLAKVPDPSAGLSSSIVAAVRRDARRRTLRRRSAVALALAASALIVVGLGFSRKSADPGRTAKELAAQPAPPAPVSPTKAPPLRDTVTEAGQAVASLTSGMADEAVDQTRRLLPIVPGTSASGLELPLPDMPARPLREAGEGVSAGLGPVASSARRAVDLFFRDLPPVGGQGAGGL